MSEPIPHRTGHNHPVDDQTHNSTSQSTEDEEVKKILKSSGVQFTPVEARAKKKQGESIGYRVESAQSRLAWTSTSPPGSSNTGIYKGRK